MSVRRAVAVAALEARFQLASPLLWALAAFAACATIAINPAAMIPTGEAAVGGLRPLANSRLALAQVMALSGLIFYTFPAAILAGHAALRDDEAAVGPLLHATPLRPAEHVAGKLAGVLLALAVVACGHTLFAMAWHGWGRHVGSTIVVDRLAPGHYFAAAALFLAPGLALCVALGYGFGERTRSPLAVYAVPSLLFPLFLASLIPRPSSALDSPLEAIFSAFDPWGARWLAETVFTADRGIAWYNQAALPVDGSFWSSRALVVIVFAFVAWAASRHCERTVRGRERTPLGPSTLSFAQPGSAPRPEHVAPRVSRRPSGLRGATLAIAAREINHLLRQPAAWMFGIAQLLVVIEHLGASRGVLDSAVTWTPGLLAVSLIEPLTTLGSLFLLFALTDALDRVRRSGSAAVLHACPVPTAALALGPCVAVLAMLALPLLASGALGLGWIALDGGAWWDAGPLLLIWGAVLAPTYLLWTSAVLAAWSATRHRATTIVFGLTALAATLGAHLNGGLTWLTNWPLWGALRWTDFGGLELEREALLLNRLLVLGVSSLLTTGAIHGFPRRERDSLRRPTGRVRPWAALVASAALVVVAGALLTAGVERGLEGRAMQARDREYWRLNVATWQGTAVPTTERVDARVELVPDHRALRVEGTFQMRHDGEEPLPALAFTVGPATRDVRWLLDGAAVVSEDRAGLHVLRPVFPLAPGAAVRVGFAYESRFGEGHSRNGGGAREFVLPGAVLLDTLGRNFLPVPGFVEGIGLTAERRHEPRPTSGSFWLAELPPVSGSRRAFHSRLEITAPANLTVVSVGVKSGERTHEGRTTTVWESGPHPVRFLSVVAGRWSQSRRDGVAVFHHPLHGRQAEAMLSTLAAARRRFSAWFGPYPWPELRLAEFPDHVTRAQGFPTLIPFSEGMGFLAGEGPGGVPAAVIVTAHEAAHQWWAHLLTPGAGPGADVLLEGLANYSTLLLLEAEHGDGARQAFARHLEERYTDHRRVDLERPLVEIVDTERRHDEAAAYDKGAWAFWMLDRQLGRETMLAGLRTFVERFHDGPDHPALPDLLAVLREGAEAPAAFDAFVDPWFRGIVLPEFEVRAARPGRDEDGRVLLTAEVANVGSGEVDVEVAALGTGPGQRELRSVRLHPGHSKSLTWSLPFDPVRVVVDPDLHLLQAHRRRGEATVAPRSPARDRDAG